VIRDDGRVTGLTRHGGGLACKCMRANTSVTASVGTIGGKVKILGPALIMLCTSLEADDEAVALGGAMANAMHVFALDPLPHARQHYTSTC
jgi:hypothetical protein